MSIFLAGFNEQPTRLEYLQKMLSNLRKENENFTIQHDNCHLTVFQERKVIDDVFIQHDKSKSWIALIGMPLVKANSNQEKQELIEKFLDDSETTILDYIDGHFSLFAYNAIDHKIIVATDFNSFIPIFYSATSDSVLFCSSELALAKLRCSEIDPLGFSHAIHLGVTWNSTTRFKGIRKMQPCEIITVDLKNRLSSRRYWKPSDEELWKGHFDTVLERWMSRLKQEVIAFYEQSVEKNTVWTDFTAGEDARLIVAQCHALNLPYRARVGGFSDPGNVDITIAKMAASAAGMDLTVDPYDRIQDEQVVEHAQNICLYSDGYGSFFWWATRFCTDLHSPLLAHSYLHFSGLPGGEAFRGTYYKRAKLLFPSRSKHFNDRFFTRMKFLLNYTPQLLHFDDTEFLESIYTNVREKLTEVEAFPAGIQVDHLLRVYQTCLWGLPKRNPFYHPLGTKDMTRSIYNVPPHFKMAGKLTKACTELLYPELARTKTQHGSPTIRRTMTRTHLFLPERFSEAKKILNGVTKRLMRFNQSSKALSGRHRTDLHSATMLSLLKNEPYAEWFKSSETMITGEMYNKTAINHMLDRARSGQCNRIETLGRIINQELACRYVYNTFN